MDVKILKDLTSESNLINENEEYFLNIIGKSYDECIISKLIYYVLNNIDLLNQLINDDKIISIDNGGTELSITNKKRIDIYYEGELNNNKKYFIIIENKINSLVHSHQCAKYYEWVNRYYKNHKIYAFLLKPYYNSTEPDDKEHYKVITYEDLYNIINNSSNVYGNELKKEIKNCLMKKEYNELDKYFLNNLENIYKRTNQLWNDINEYFKRLTKEFNVNEAYKFENTYSKDHTYIRFFKNIWWSGYKDNLNDQYYFYFEIYYSMNLKRIFIQETIKRYNENPDSKINNFMNNKSIDYRNIEHKNFYIIKKFFFNSSVENVFSDEWKVEFESWFKKHISIAANDIDEIFNKFKSNNE